MHVSPAHCSRPNQDRKQRKGTKMTQATVRKSNVEQDSTWKTCFSCDATYYGATCSKCDADANRRSKTRTRHATPARWQAALQRAMVANLAYMELTGTDGAWAISSTRDDERGYLATTHTCTCQAALSGDEVCLHRALVRALTGTMPEPERVTFSGDANRQEVRVDGLVYGDAVADAFGGWVLLQGRFPHAKQRGTFCSLDEIKRDLERRLPAAIPVQPTVQIISAMADSAEMASVA